MIRRAARKTGRQDAALSFALNYLFNEILDGVLLAPVFVLLLAHGPSSMLDRDDARRAGVSRNDVCPGSLEVSGSSPGTIGNVCRKILAGKS